MIKAIIFDCFGVLVGKGFNRTYSLAGGDPVKDEAFIKDILDRANRGLLSNEEFDVAVSEKLNVSLEAWQRAVDKADSPDEQLLGYIKELHRSYRTAVLSNSNRGVLKYRISSVWLEDCFDKVIVSAEIGLVKPDPQIYSLAARRLGVELEECVFIDDKTDFVEAASQLNMKAILYTNFNNLKKELGGLLN